MAYVCLNTFKLLRNCNDNIDKYINEIFVKITAEELNNKILNCTNGIFVKPPELSNKIIHCTNEIFAILK